MTPSRVLHCLLLGKYEAQGSMPTHGSGVALGFPPTTTPPCQFFGKKKAGAAGGEAEAMNMNKKKRLKPKHEVEVTPGVVGWLAIVIGREGLALVDIAYFRNDDGLHALVSLDDGGLVPKTVAKYEEAPRWCSTTPSI